MSKKRILYISQEIMPFLPETEISKSARQLPQSIQAKGKDVRIFMPRFGVINERRHQLHEVIRLSGMNLVIDDMDHPLLIKVASIPQARLQVYFIDNEDYFTPKRVFFEKDGTQVKNNDERAMFFSRGVLETVKKLGWKPDVIHCHGWFAGLLPLYIKKFYGGDPHFEDVKVVYSVYDNKFEGDIDPRFSEKLEMDNFEAKDIELLKNPTSDKMQELGCKYSDAIILGSEKINPEINDYIQSLNVDILPFQKEEEMIKAYDEFYDQVLEDTTVS